MFSGFPDAPNSRDYTCTRSSENGQDYVTVDGLAFSFVQPFTAATTLGFEDFLVTSQGDRFGVDILGTYQGFDWAYGSATKIATWGSFTVQHSGALGGNSSYELPIPGAGESENWLKARASSVGKGAKITNQDGFVFESMKLFTQDHPAFVGRVNVTWRTIDNVTSAATPIDLVDDAWIEVTADDLGAKGLTLKAMWFNAPGITKPNGAKFGLDDFTVEGDAGEVLAKLVFVTSQTYTGNLGGLAGADAKCQTLAHDANLPGTYQAWLSDSTGSPSTLFAQSQVPYQLVDGTVIADNWADLVDGELLAPINLTESGGAAPIGETPCHGVRSTWSDTSPNGERDTTNEHLNSCNNWSDGSSQNGRCVGNTDLTGPLSQWSCACTAIVCSWRSALYCFQQ